MNKINEAMDKISPSEEQKNRIFDKAVSMAKSGSEKSLRRTTFFKDPIDTDDIAEIVFDGVYFEFG